MGNQFTSCCELHRLAEDDEIHNVNDEQVEEEQHAHRGASASAREFENQITGI